MKVKIDKLLLLKNITVSKYIFLICFVILLVISLVGCAPLYSLFQNPRYIYENGAVLVGGDNQPIELENNSNAEDVTYESLMEFIKADPSDQYQYIARGTSGGAIPFVCSDFAEGVHNNAESAGIRAGYVGIDFEGGGLGHAINVFETTDMGTIYIDCTGQSDYSQIEEEGSSNPVISWDKVGYVEIGKKYGVIGLDYAKSPNYSFFEQYDQQWQEYKAKLAAYNAEVKQYNQEIKGVVYRQGSPELKRIQIWETQLREKEKALNDLSKEIGNSRFKPLGIVKSVTIHW